MDTRLCIELGSDGQPVFEKLMANNRTNQSRSVSNWTQNCVAMAPVNCCSLTRTWNVIRCWLKIGLVCWDCSVKSQRNQWTEKTNWTDTKSEPRTAALTWHEGADRSSSAPSTCAIYLQGKFASVAGGTMWPGGTKWGKSSTVQGRKSFSLKSFQ